VASCARYLADVAVIIGLYHAIDRLGSAFGQILAGSVWGNETIAQSTHNAPYATIELYPIGTLERAGMVASYAAVQKLLAIGYFTAAGAGKTTEYHSSASVSASRSFAGLCS
jgi:hypothetical protein